MHVFCVHVISSEINFKTKLPLTLQVLVLQGHFKQHFVSSEDEITITDL